jgi:hypothetical protein
VGAGHGPQHLLDAGGHARLVGGALEDAGPDAGLADALLDVAHEPVGHELDAAAGEEAAEVHVQGDVVVGVDAGGDDDLHAGLLRDPLDARHVAAQADHGQVDDRVDAAVLQLVELGDGVRDLTLLVPPDVEVLHHLRREDEHVLVHERATEVGGVDRTPDRLHLRHGVRLPSAVRGSVARSRSCSPASYRRRW